MADIAYVNGSFVEMNNATVSIKDRGLLFGDGVYEVAGVFEKAVKDGPRRVPRGATWLIMWRLSSMCRWRN